MADYIDGDDCAGTSSNEEGSSIVHVASENKVGRRWKKSTGTSVFILPYLHSRSNLVSLATRLKMTPTQQAAFTQGLIAESEGNLPMVATSYATADRSRRNVIAEIATKLHEDWTHLPLCTLHWDGKLTPTLTNHWITEERLTVIAGDSVQLELLGVPSYTKAADQSTSTIIAEVTMNLMEKWRFSDQIVTMTYDTMSSNTRHLSGSCIAIQEKLQQAVLWSGCRHHISEVLLSHIFTDLNIEPFKSPDVMLFSRLGSNWELVAHKPTRQFLSIQPTTPRRHWNY